MSRLDTRQVGRVRLMEVRIAGEQCSKVEVREVGGFKMVERKEQLTDHRFLF